ncbi:hypothetical protein ONE63_002234 [Megalurothrips usitatus]|uniref:C2H2-type domain-containing protein n=1 Tax=Megalurothrips usitatus TaxID=439358 RepID=A0AAV7XB30_9NEOP|nr:hypothetical protein ONE63_002234 [Megalurothrips usitatus]
MEEDLESLKCSHCSKSYSTKLYLLKHIKAVHKSKQDMSITTVCECKFCGKGFASVFACNRHESLKHSNALPQRRQSLRKCPKPLHSQEDQSAKAITKMDEDQCSSKVNLTNGSGSKKKIVSLDQSDEKEKIQCKECLKTFVKKNNLNRHSVMCKTLKGKPPRLKSCPFSENCDFECTSKTDLQNHLKELHNTEPNIFSDLKCDHCSFVFARKTSLKKHMMICGRKESVVTPKPCTYSEECQFRYRVKKALRAHLQEFHKVDMKEPETFHFNTYRDFLKWKEVEEDSSFSYFSAQTGIKKNKRIFYCQRDGSAAPHKKQSSNFNRRRKSGRMKTGAVCFASICCTFKEDQSVSVVYYPTHSHPLQEDDIKNHPLPPLAVEEVNEKLSLGACPSEIENYLKNEASACESHESDCGSKLTRRSRHKLKSIKERLRRNNMKLKSCSNNATAFVKAEHIEHLTEESRAEEQMEELIYEAEVFENSNNSSDCFMIDFQNPEGAEVLSDGANVVIVLDDKHGCSQFMNVVMPDSVDSTSGHATNLGQEIISLCNDIISLTGESTVPNSVLSDAVQTLQSLKHELVTSVKVHEDSCASDVPPILGVVQSDELQKQMSPFGKTSKQEDSSSKNLTLKKRVPPKESSPVNIISAAPIDSIVTSILTINVPSLPDPSNFDSSQTDEATTIVVPSQPIVSTQIIDIPFTSIAPNRTITVPSQPITGETPN